MATPARADLQIWIKTGSAPTSANNVGALVVSGGGISTASYTNPLFDSGKFNVNVLTTVSNTPGTQESTFLTGSEATLTNNTSGTLTLFITVGATGYTAPTTPPDAMLTSEIGGTVVVGSGANAITFTSIINNNIQNGTTPIAGPFLAPQVSGGAGFNVKTTGSAFENSVALNIPSLPITFGLTETFAITLGAHSTIGFHSSTTLATIAPEPSSMAIAGLGALGMVGYGLRRRKALGA